MSYFKIGNNDYSTYVSGLKVKKAHNFNAQTNANGDTVVDYINSKREIEVSIIPLTEADAFKLLNDVSKFNVSISYRNPETKMLEQNVNCIISDNEIEYYTIQADKVRLKEFSLTFTEL